MRTVLVLTVALAVLATSGGAAAQQTREARLEQLRAELSEIESELRAAEQRAEIFFALDAARTQRNVAAKTDTAAVGPLRIVAEPALVGEARAMFEPVWAELAWAGAGIGDFSDVVFVYDPAGRLGRVRFLDEVHRITGRTWRSLDVDPDAVRRNVRAAIGREITARSYPAEVKAWAGGLGPVPTPESALPKLYRDLALAPAHGAVRCFEAGGEACWVALGLGGGARAYERWYDLDAVRAAMAEQWERPARFGLRRWRSGAAAILYRCIAGEAEFCGDFNAVPRVWQQTIPLPASLRADLVAFAVTLGGEGAIERFVSGLAGLETVGQGGGPISYVDFSTGLRRAILAASQMDEDELMSRWRERILAHRPDQATGAERSRTASLAWILLFAAFATRSSRWRLG